MIKVIILIFLTGWATFMVTQRLDESQNSLVQRKIKLEKFYTFQNAIKGVFSPDGKLLALSGRDQVEIIDLAARRRLGRLGLENATMLGVRFSPDGRLVASAHKIVENSQRNRFEVTLWDAASGRKKLTLPVVEDEWYRVVDDLSFSPDGKLLASNLGGVPRLWKTSDGREFRRFEAPGENWESQRVLLTPDGSRLAAYFTRANPAADVIRIWNIQSEKYIDIATNVYRDWDFSNDSKLLAVTAIQDKGRPTERSGVEIWEVESSRRIKIIEVPKEWRGAYVVSFSPDGQMIGIGGYKRFGVFSMQTGNLLADGPHADRRLFGDNQMPNELTDIEFSPDGNLLLTGGNDGTVKLWKVKR